MAKGWSSIVTVNNVANTETADQKKRRFIKAEQSFHHQKNASYKDMKDRSEKSYLEQQKADGDLLIAFENKKLKSKTAIKRALRLKKERAEHKDAKQNTDTTPTNVGSTNGEEVTESPA